MKNLILILSLASGLIDAAEFANWKTFKNKYGWEIMIPNCWEADGIEDVPPPNNPSVGFSPGKDCKITEPPNRRVSVTSVLQVKESSPESRIKTAIEIAKQSSRNLMAIERLVGGKSLKMTVSVSSLESRPGRNFNLIAQTNCDSKNVSIAINFDLQPKQMEIPDSQITIPAELEQILNSYKCTKP